MTSATQLTPLRYTAPTVTLEVMARAAAVSQWSDQPVVQILRYQLQIRSFSDEGEPIEIRGDRASFLPLAEAVETYVQAQVMGLEAVSDRGPATPYLEPQGLTQHTLHLGTLRTHAGSPIVQLGAIQLSDLSDVLEQLHSQVRPLPVALTTQTAQRRPWRQWGAAAAGIVAAVGVTTVLWPEYQTQLGVNETATEAPTADQVPSAADIPDDVARSPATETAPDPESTPDTAAPDTLSNEAQPDELQALERIEPVPESAPQPRSLPSSDSTPKRQPAPAAADAPPSPAGAGIPAPPTAETTPRRIAPAPQAATSAPEPNARANDQARSPAAIAPAASELAESTADSATATDEAPEAFSAMEGQAESEALIQSSPADAAPGSLADLVEKIRDRWSPPANLDQPLVYTLVFAADGTLSEVIPEDDLAESYLDQTGIPAVGTESLTTGEPRVVRLVLQPDGKVTSEEVTPDPIP